MTAHDHAAKARALLKEAMHHLEDCKPTGVLQQMALDKSYADLETAVYRLTRGFGLEERRDEAA